MTTDEKLAAILAAVQTDPGNRGLAEMFAYYPCDFATACRSIAMESCPRVRITTGFFIPTSSPPAFETDGPLGAHFLHRAVTKLGGRADVCSEEPVLRAIATAIGPFRPGVFDLEDWDATHRVWVERAGQAADGRHYTMRGRDTSSALDPQLACIIADKSVSTSIGIGDGGNEIGMGKIPHEIVAKNIPNGDLIHCRVPTDHLIVCGVSNWGAYALAAGVYVLRGVKPPANLFDPDREREILEVMVREGPLVDGVTGKQTATVDGLTWDEYVKPLIRIREILES